MRICGIGDGSWVEVGNRTGTGIGKWTGQDESGVICVFGLYVVR